MKSLNIEDIHTILLQIAKEFHQICVKHDIPYYMLGGTMLGTIRHKGFIPWDDDMDFGIPRKHYKRFCEVAIQELSGRYKMLMVDNSAYAVLGIGKLSDSNTWLKEIYSVKTEERLGVNIDVFPLDYTDSRTDLLSVNMRARILFKFQKLLFMNSENRSFVKRILARVCQYIFQISPTTIPHYIDRMMLGRNINPTMLANIFGAWAMKETVSLEIMGTPTLYNFEDTEFYGPQNADAYLKQLYGNYMQLPPENKRHIHTTEVYMLDDAICNP